MKDKINCNVVLDLLPLYHDKVVSEDTKKMVEEHMESCPSCKAEYKSISIELPDVEVESTKEQYTHMVKKQQNKRIAILIGIILILVIGVSLMYTAPDPTNPQNNALVPQEDIKIAKVYKVETEKGYEFCVIYETDSYSSMWWGEPIEIDISKSKEHPELIINIYVDKNAAKYDDSEKINDIVTTQTNGSMENVKTLTFAGKEVWSEDDQEALPEYLDLYLKGLNEIPDHFFQINVEENHIGMIYADGRVKYWDLDGKVLFDHNFIDDLPADYFIEGYYGEGGYLGTSWELNQENDFIGVWLDGILMYWDLDGNLIFDENESNLSELPSRILDNSEMTEWLR